MRDAIPHPRGALASRGAVVSAILASLCCTGPVLFVTLGIGAGLASTFEPLRPVFVALTVVLLGLGSYVVYRPRRAAPGSDSGCAPGASCPPPRSRGRDTLILWAATLLALALLSFPEWSKLLV